MGNFNSILKQKLNAYRSEDADSKAFDLVCNGDYVMSDTDTGAVIIANYEGGGVFNPDIYNERDKIADFIRAFPEVEKCEIKEINNVPNAVEFIVSEKKTTTDATPGEALEFAKKVVPILTINGKKEYLLHQLNRGGRIGLIVKPADKPLTDEIIGKLKTVAEENHKDFEAADSNVIIWLDDKKLTLDGKPPVKIDQEDVDFLIEDEEEAIDGYKEILSRITDKEQVKVLKSIMADEKRHIKMVKALLK